MTLLFGISPTLKKDLWHLIFAQSFNFCWNDYQDLMFIMWKCHEWMNQGTTGHVTWNQLAHIDWKLSLTCPGVLTQKRECQAFQPEQGLEIRPIKLEMLGSSVSHLTSPRKILGKKNLGWKFFEHPGWHETSRNVLKSENRIIFLEVKKKNLDEKKFEKLKFPQNESCSKLPELPRNHVFFLRD